MIVSFRCAETQAIWNGERSRRLPGDIQAVALRKLRLLSAAKRLDDLRVPTGNRLEALLGERAGQHSIRINDQGRLCFRWSEGGPADLQSDFDLLERKREIGPDLDAIHPHAA